MYFLEILIKQIVLVIEQDYKLLIWAKMYFYKCHYRKKILITTYLFQGWIWCCWV